MADITVENLSKVVGITPEVMLKQMKDAGLAHSDISDLVKDEDKKILLDFLKKETNTNFFLSEKLDDVYFSFDQYNIDESAKRILSKNAEWLKYNPALKVQLAGHCDERGTNNYNIALGNKRALYIKKQLAFLGISKDRLFSISYGEEKPTCWEGEEKCWSKNRRVQFLIISD